MNKMMLLHIFFSLFFVSNICATELAERFNIMPFESVEVKDEKQPEFLQAPELPKEQLKSEINAQKCRDAREAVVRDALGDVLDPEYVAEQKSILQQCREEGTLLKY